MENTKYLWPGHSRSYMKRKGGFGVEFFADVFASTATKNTSDLEFVTEFLPNSYSAFKEVLEHLKAVIGHVSSSKALDIYLHSTDKMQKEAARSID